MSSDNYRPDREINVRLLVRLTIGLLALVAVSFVAMWKLTLYLQDQEMATDPPPPALAEARQPHEPPSPRLQSEPLAEYAAYRTAAEGRLSSYGWSDEARRMAHIPIERAFDLVLENGLPESLAVAVPAQVEPEN